MKPLFNPKVTKYIQKLKDKDLYDLIQKSIDSIIKDPLTRKLLEHPFRKYQIRSKNFSHNGNSYRLAYTISQDKKELLFLLIDSRENFYKKLEKFCR